MTNYEEKYMKYKFKYVKMMEGGGKGMHYSNIIFDNDRIKVVESWNDVKMDESVYVADAGTDGYRYIGKVINITINSDNQNIIKFEYLNGPPEFSIYEIDTSKYNTTGLIRKLELQTSLNS